MKVILKADIKGVGKKDEIINASDGHARNYIYCYRNNYFSFIRNIWIYGSR